MGLSAGLMIKPARARFPTEAGDGNLFNCKRGLIAHCFPLSPSVKAQINNPSSLSLSKVFKIILLTLTLKCKSVNSLFNCFKLSLPFCHCG